MALQKETDRKLMVSKNTFYFALFILLIIHISYISFNFYQIGALRNSLEETSKNLTRYIDNSNEEMERINQQNFNEVARSITELQEKLDVFEGEVSSIKSSTGDFSGVIEMSIRSVVSVMTESSVGTGFFVDGEGYLVTNEHVIDDSNQVTIQTYDRKRYSAEIIGVDVKKDLALLKINEGVDYLELADSNELQVGRKVIAIGNPLGLSFSVTEGIISALNRKGPNGLNEYIQTDVSLNPGNSGGPLIDTEGRVAGINNFKIGDAESLGFALESNSIRETINILANSTIIE